MTPTQIKDRLSRIETTSYIFGKEKGIELISNACKEAIKLINNLQAENKRLKAKLKESKKC